MWGNDVKLLLILLHSLCVSASPSERPLHYQERVLPILHSFGTDSHLLIKKYLGMEAMITYLSERTDQQSVSLWCPLLLVFSSLSYSAPSEQSGCIQTRNDEIQRGTKHPRLGTDLWKFPWQILHPQHKLAENVQGSQSKIDKQTLSQPQFLVS